MISLKKITLVAAAVLSFVSAYADEVQFPALTGPVVDTVNLLTAEQRNLLSQKSVSFQSAKGSQIAICIVATTSPLPIEDYGIKLAERWKIGRGGIGDGIIIVVAKNDRKMRIEVGRGLEHAVTDLRAGRIIDRVMAPEFRKGDFYAGLNSAVDSLITLINGGDIPGVSSKAAVTSSYTQKTDGNSAPAMILVVAAIILFIVLLAMGKHLLSVPLTYIPFTAGLYMYGFGSVGSSAISGLFFMIPFVIIALIKKFATGGNSSSSGYSSGYSYSSSDSYSSSSSGSDSYSGGGGDFGGGGSSGDW